MVTRYTLFVSASAGASWSGGVLKARTPPLLMEKSAESSPNRDQAIWPFSGFVTV